MPRVEKKPAVARENKVGKCMALLSSMTPEEREELIELMTNEWCEFGEKLPCECHEDEEDEDGEEGDEDEDGEEEAEEGEDTSEDTV